MALLGRQSGLLARWPLILASGARANYHMSMLACKQTEKSQSAAFDHPVTPPPNPPFLMSLKPADELPHGTA